MTRRDRLRERGAAAVEFALILPVLLILVGGVIDFGRLYYTQIQLANAARDGVRLAALGATYTTAQIQGRVVTAASPLTVVTGGVTVTACSGAGSSAVVTVVPATAFSWTVLGMVPGIPLPSLQGKATMTCV